MSIPGLVKRVDVIGIRHQLIELEGSPELLYGYLINFFMGLPEEDPPTLDGLRMERVAADIPFDLAHISEIIKAVTGRTYFTLEYYKPLSFGAWDWIGEPGIAVARMAEPREELQVQARTAYVDLPPSWRDIIHGAP